MTQKQPSKVGGGRGIPAPTYAKVQNWGWAFELKYDSLPRLDFKGGVFCTSITDPPVG